jgi:hypothetical protein
MSVKLPNFRQFLTRERAVLMACMGIALCFWVLNRLSNSFKKTVAVRLEYVLPQGKALRIAPPQYGQVTWQGTGWDLITGREQTVRIPLQADSIQFVSLKNLMWQQFGNDVIGVSPEQITIALEESATKWVKVEAVSDLKFARGFDLADEIRCEPSAILVEGPRSHLSTLTSIQTDTLKFDRLKDSAEAKIPLAESPIYRYAVSEVNAKIKVEQFTEKTIFIPVTLKNAPAQLNVYRIFPNRIRLDCTVALSRYASLSPTNFEAEVDLKNVDIQSKNNTLPITLTLKPAYVRNLKFSPKSVEFYFER